MGDFSFNGVSASDMGLVVERYPDQHTPRKRMTVISIPGRSGDLHYWDGSFENFTQRYACWFKSAPVSLQARRIKQWLLSAPAGARLEDDYDDAVFHLATYRGGGDIESCLNRFGRFTVEFDCAAPAYLKSGELAFELSSKTGEAAEVFGLLNNPSAWPSLPLIEVTGITSGVVYIGDSALMVRFPGVNELRTFYVDCDTREAWEIVDGTEVSRNEWITVGEFPQIAPGRNEVSFLNNGNTGIQSVRITPRWWTV